MAVGDRIPTELVAPTALAAAATTVFTNSGASYRTQLTQIWLCNTGASSRTITFFKNGLATANQIANSIVIPANGSIILDTKIVFTGSQTFGAMQGTGTDVNINCYGVVEQIA